MNHRLLFPAVLLCFFLSGATALIYEVLWVRLLVLQLGSTSLAVSSVITAFMAGLALGSLVCGQYSSRLHRPLAIYAALELGIAVAAILIPTLLEWLQPLHRTIWETFQPRFMTFSLLRFYFAFLLLLVPTAMMGATLPLLSKACVHYSDQAARRVGLLYGINTLGAVLGTVGTGFLLIPSWGMTQTLYFAAAVNLLVALVAWRLHIIWSRTSENAGMKPIPSQKPILRLAPHRHPTWLHFTLLAALVVSGFTSMVYQVTWSRTLSLVIGSSVYGFTIVLATFLGGIALGSVIVSRWAGSRGRSSLWWVAGTQAFIGCGAYATTSLVNHLPYYYARGYHYVEGDTVGVYLVSLALSALIILPPTLGMGATFPLVIAFFSESIQGVGHLVGKIYSLNTVGAILGAFTGGFLLLPFVGIRYSIVAAVTLNLSAAALVMVSGVSSNKIRTAICLSALGLIGVVVAMPPGWNSLLMSSGMYKYAYGLKKDFSDADFRQYTQDQYQLLFYEEGLNTTITVLQEGPHRLLVTNGKIDASDQFDLPSQLLSAHLPLLFHSRPQDVCLIGLGSGMTAGSALLHPIRSLALLELESVVVKASHYFDAVNHRPLSDPRTELILSDARNYLSMSKRQFDVIISEPSNPWITGVSNLFTREFFEIVRSRLRPQGIFAQWVQLYEMAPEDLRSLLATFAAVFPHVQIFCSIEETDLILVGADSPLFLDVPFLNEKLGRPEILADLSRINVGHAADLLSYFKIGKDEISRLTAGSLINTDDNAHIEFSAPFHLGVPTRKQNREILDSATAGPVPYLTGIAEPEMDLFLERLEISYRDRSKTTEAQLVAQARRRITTQ